jgi:hypothetical protein
LFVGFLGENEFEDIDAGRKVPFDALRLLRIGGPPQKRRVNPPNEQRSSFCIVMKISRVYPDSDSRFQVFPDLRFPRFQISKVYKYMRIYLWTALRIMVLRKEGLRMRGFVQMHISVCVCTYGVP